MTLQDPRLYSSTRAAAWLCAALLCATASSTLAAGKAAPNATPSQPEPAEAGDAALCGSLKKTLMARISSLKSLEVSIAKDREKPAATLSGLFTEWTGGSYTGVAIKRKLNRLERERAMAVELNRLLASSGCSQVDIDAEMKNAAPVPAAEDETRSVNDPSLNDPLRNSVGR